MDYTKKSSKISKFIIIYFPLLLISLITFILGSKIICNKSVLDEYHFILLIKVIFIVGILIILLLSIIELYRNIGIIKYDNEEKKIKLEKLKMNLGKYEDEEFKLYMIRLKFIQEKNRETYLESILRKESDALGNSYNAETDGQKKNKISEAIEKLKIDIEIKKNKITELDAEIDSIKSTLDTLKSERDSKK